MMSFSKEQRFFKIAIFCLFIAVSLFWRIQKVEADAISISAEIFGLGGLCGIGELHITTANGHYDLSTSDSGYHCGSLGITIQADCNTQITATVVDTATNDTGIVMVSISDTDTGKGTGSSAYFVRGQPSETATTSSSDLCKYVCSNQQCIQGNKESTGWDCDLTNPDVCKPHCIGTTCDPNSQTGTTCDTSKPNSCQYRCSGTESDAKCVVGGSGIPCTLNSSDNNYDCKYRCNLQEQCIQGGSWGGPCDPANGARACPCPSEIDGHPAYQCNGCKPTCPGWYPPVPPMCLYHPDQGCCEALGTAICIGTCTGPECPTCTGPDCCPGGANCCPGGANCPHHGECQQDGSCKQVDGAGSATCPNNCAATCSDQTCMPNGTGPAGGTPCPNGNSDCSYGCFNQTCVKGKGGLACDSSDPDACKPRCTSDGRCLPPPDGGGKLCLDAFACLTCNSEGQCIPGGGGVPCTQAATCKPNPPIPPQCGLAGSPDPSTPVVYPAGSTSFYFRPTADVWIPNFGDGTVTKLDDSTGNQAQGSPYNVGNGPAGIAVDSLGNVWISNFYDNSVTELDSSGNQIGSAYPVGATPTGIAADTSGNVWVANNGNSVTELNGSTGNPMETYTVGNYPQGVAIDSKGNIWVANNYGNSVTEIDPKKLPADPTATITYTGTGFNGPFGIAIDASDNVWVANSGGNTVTKLNGSTGNVMLTALVGNNPFSVAIDASNHVWVANASDSNVTELDGVSGSQIGQPHSSAGTYPFGVAIDASGNVWIANEDSGTVTKLDPAGNQIGQSHQAGNQPYSFGDFTGFATQHFLPDFCTIGTPSYNGLPVPPAVIPFPSATTPTPYKTQWTCENEGESVTCNASITEETKVNCGPAEGVYSSVDTSWCDEPGVCDSAGNPLFCTSDSEIAFGIANPINNYGLNPLPDFPNALTAPPNVTFWNCISPDGGENAYGCTANIEPSSYCGDGVVDPTQGETCDPGSPATDVCTVAGQSCSSNCTCNGGQRGTCGPAAQAYLIGATQYNGAFCKAGDLFYKENPASDIPWPNADSTDIYDNPTPYSESWDCVGSTKTEHCTATVPPPPTSCIPGVCGSAAKTYPLSATGYGNDTFCSTERPPKTLPSFPSGRGPSNEKTWTCPGMNGGGDATCHACINSNNNPVNGACE